MKTITLSICFALVSGLLTAQTNFSGKWLFDNQESISGKLYSNGSPKSFTVKQSEQDIMIEKTTTGTNGDITSKETILIGGKVTQTTTASGRPRKSSIQFNADKTGFTQVTDIFNATEKTKLEMKITDEWKMENGKLLLTRKNENFTNGEVWESKAWYNKVND